MQNLLYHYAIIILFYFFVNMEDCIMKKTRQAIYILVALCCAALHGMDSVQKSDDIFVQHIQKILVAISDSDQMAYINSHNLLQKEAGNGHVTAVEFLIRHGATIDGYDAEGKTALHQAAYNGHFDVIKVLVCYAANINKLDKQGSTCMQNVMQGFTDYLNIANQSNFDGFARKHEFLAAGKYLIDNGACFKQTQNRPKTADIASLEQELLLYQQNRLTIRQQIDETACVLASALHERLGTKSPLAMLGQPLVYEISRMVAEEIKKDQSQIWSTGKKNKKCVVKTCVVQ